MASMNMFFVREVTDDAIAAVRAMFPADEMMTNSEFIRLRLIVFTKNPEQELMELSSRLKTDVWWLRYHSISGVFGYYHWRLGVLLRAIVRGHIEDRTWERVEGQPEPWEQALFFNPETLADLLEDEDNYLDDDEEEDIDEYKRQLEAFYQKGELVIGRMEPYISAQSCTFDIATYYRFPGWDR